jgi:4-hydroxy-2-oxoheptanedioate aldolase
MLSNLARQKLQQQQPLLGVLSPTTDPVLCEYLGFAGFDFYMIDGEHGAITLSEVSQLVRACEVAHIPCLARIRGLDEKLILQYLDAGVGGVMIPGIKTADDVRRLVQAVKYPPHGQRGLGPVRAADYLMGAMTQAEYVAYANATTLVLPQIEDLECVHNLDEILRVEGVDGFIIGPRDLAMSMGYFDGPNHPEVKALIGNIAAKVLAAGKHFGTVAATAEQAKDLMAQGATIILNSVQGLLTASAKNFLAARS